MVVAGQTYQIRRLNLRQGLLVITADGPLPDKAAVAEPATVFGEDGQGFAQAWPCDIPARKEAPYGQNWVTIELPLRLARVENE